MAMSSKPKAPSASGPTSGSKNWCTSQPNAEFTQTDAESMEMPVTKDAPLNASFLQAILGGTAFRKS
jgi:hypothetical protein